MGNQLEWHKFTKKTMPDENFCGQILVCRDLSCDPFFVVVTVDCGMYSYNVYDGMRTFEPERNDRWAYIPDPEGAVRY